MTQVGQTVLHFTGHRISGAGLQTVFPADQEARVAGEIAATLEALDVAAAFGSLAAGADLLIAEALTARAVPLTLVFPFTIADFRVTSVAPSGNRWLPRFNRIVALAANVEVLDGLTGDDDAYARCARHTMDLAVTFAVRRSIAALQIAVWDGIATRLAAGTSADVTAWRGRRLPTRVIAPA